MGKNSISLNNLPNDLYFNILVLLDFQSFLSFKLVSKHIHKELKDAMQKLYYMVKRKVENPNYYIMDIPDTVLSRLHHQILFELLTEANTYKDVLIVLDKGMKVSLELVKKVHPKMKNSDLSILVFSHFQLFMFTNNYKYDLEEDINRSFISGYGGIALNTRDKDGKTLLMGCIENYNLNSIEVLMKYMKNLNLVLADQEGRNAVYLLANNPYIRNYIRYHKDENIRGLLFKIPFLQQSLNKLHQKIVQIENVSQAEKIAQLLKQKEIRRFDPKNDPLTTIAYYFYDFDPEAAQLLNIPVFEHMKLDALNQSKYTTPLHKLNFKSKESCSVIEEFSSLVNMRDGFGNTPLHYAATFKGCKTVVKKLIEVGAEVNAINMDGDTPLHLAVINNSAIAARCLVDAGAKVDITNNLCQEPIHSVTNINAKIADILSKPKKNKAEDNLQITKSGKKLRTL